MRTLVHLILVLQLLVVVAGCDTTAATALTPGDWFGDANIKIYLAVDNRSITTADQTNPIEINTGRPTLLTLRVNVTSSVAVYNFTGAINFHYQGFKVFTIDIRQAFGEYMIPPNTSLPEVDAELNLAEILTTQVGTLSISAVTGIYETSVDFYYYLDGDDPATQSPRTFNRVFFVLIPPGNLLDVVTSVVGAVTTVATVGAVSGVAINFKALLDGLSTAHKIRSIQKKAGELRTLPNLTVIGALPALFSLTAVTLTGGGGKKGKKKSSDGVSEFRLNQRLREVAPDVFPRKKCPKCKAKWHRELTECTKCHISLTEASQMYAEYLISKSPQAIRVLDKKKALSIKRLSKATKLSQYNAGVVGAAMVDTGLTEITKVETPFRGFVTNSAGLMFLILTWQQLLGGAASSFQTTLTFVGAVLSVAVMVSLFFARKTQIQKLRVTIEEHPHETPGESTETEADSGAETGPAAEPTTRTGDSDTTGSQ
ncbi:MAG: hypothetical protein QXS20_07880 [Candidatus Thorarchaeota archaeon]